MRMHSLSANRIIEYYRMYERRAKTRMILSSCTWWSEYARIFAGSKAHFRLTRPIWSCGHLAYRFLRDFEILKELVQRKKHLLYGPFCPNGSVEGIVFNLSSYGHGIHLKCRFQILFAILNVFLFLFFLFFFCFLFFKRMGHMQFWL